jgi:hypothetical protein
MFGLGKLFRKREAAVDDVARALIPHLRALRPSSTFDFDAALGTIRTQDGGVINLANLHTDYLRTPPDQRDKLLRTFAMGVLPPEVPSSFAEAKDALLPALRYLPGMDQSRIVAEHESLDAITESMLPFSASLLVSVVHDTEHAMQQVSSETLKGWGMTPAQALEVAVDNLRHRAPPRFHEIAPGLWCSGYGDYYDAARILLPELVWQLRLAGTPVAMVPNRACLLVAGDMDSEALLSMIAKAREVLTAESRPLASEMLRLEDGRWLPWQPPMPAAAAALAKLQAEITAGDYAAQKQVLDELHQRRGSDVFVATCSLVQRPDGQLLSYSVLSKGVDTWLPRTDRVVFVDPDRPKGAKKVVEWRVFEAQFGHHIEALALVPPRFHVREHPSDEAIASLPEGDL